MKSSSIRHLLTNKGISSPKEYRDSLIHEWYLPRDYQNNLAVYHLKETTPIEFFQNLKDGELVIGERSYSITFINSPSVLRRAQTLLISFRYCEDLERGYALVKELKGDGHFEQLEYNQPKGSN